MSTVVIIQKGSGEVYGVFSTWKAASDHFSKFIQVITVEDMKHLAMTHQSRKVQDDRYYFRQFKVSKTFRS